MSGHSLPAPLPLPRPLELLRSLTVLQENARRECVPSAGLASALQIHQIHVQSQEPPPGNGRRQSCTETGPARRPSASPAGCPQDWSVSCWLRGLTENQFPRDTGDWVPGIPRAGRRAICRPAVHPPTRVPESTASPQGLASSGSPFVDNLLELSLSWFFV